MVRPMSYIGPSGLVRQSAPRPGDAIRIETCIVNSRRSTARFHRVSRAAVVLSGGFRFDRRGRDLAPSGFYRRLVGPAYDVPPPEGATR